MQPHITTLPNGLKIQIVPMPGTEVVTTLVLVGAGSRYETYDIAGISHFLEHMFFKGGVKYPTPKSVAEAIDSFGGEFNAFTGKEYAGYYVKSGKQNLDKSLDVLSDMLLDAQFPKEEIEKERGVILEEMAMYLDAPMYQISWDFENLVFGDQPLGWDQIGTRELITSVTQAQFNAYKNELYVPGNTVITLAGAVDESVVEKVQQAFRMGERTQARQMKPFDAEKVTEQIFLREKKTEQFHISCGVRAISERDERFPAAKVLSTILGGNMSSRMFQTVREEKGLCYSIRTLVDEFTDTGLLTTRAGVRLDQVMEATAAIKEEYDKIAQSPVTPEELKNAQNYLCGKTDLGTEDTEHVAHHFGKDVLLYGETETFEEWKEKVRAVTQAEIQSLAQALLADGQLKFAGIGPSLDREKLRGILGG